MTRRRGDVGRAVRVLVVGAVCAVGLGVGAAGAWAAPPNDDFADAIAVTGSPAGVTVEGSNLDATYETDETTLIGTGPSNGGHSVWYSYTPAQDGRVTIDTCGASYDTFLTVFTGARVDSLTEVVYNDDDCGLASRVTFDVTAGETYRIAVDSFSEPQQGSFPLTVTGPPAAAGGGGSAPVALDDAYSAVGGETLSVSAPGVLGNDSDAGVGSLSAVDASDPANGSVTLNADGSFDYTPDEDFAGSDSFTYRANEGDATSDPATVTIEVTATCGERVATIVGTAGDDTLTGTRGDDVIAGLGGNDIIKSGNGEDLVCGGAGNDTINAASGLDRVFGGAGADNVQGGPGADVILGGAGDDVLAGGAGDDSLSGDDGVDRLSGGADADTLDGGAGTPDRCDGGKDSGGDTATAACEKTTNVP